MLRTQRGIAQRWLVAFGIGVVMTGMSAVQEKWWPAVALAGLTVFAGAMGGWRWRQTGGA
jgi:hypothetical protein